MFDPVIAALVISVLANVLALIKLYTLYNNFRRVQLDLDTQMHTHSALVDHLHTYVEREVQRRLAKRTSNASASQTSSNTNSRDSLSDDIEELDRFPSADY